MKFTDLTNGTVDGTGALILTMNDKAVEVERCSNVTFANFEIVGLRHTTFVKRVRITWLVVRFIWSLK